MNKQAYPRSFTNASGTMTDRKSNFLSRQFGFKDHDHFAQELPSNARVLDVGAGFSSLGSDTAKKRPDVDWTNLDINYDAYAWHENPQFFTNNPENLSLVEGDATKLVQMFGQKSMDRVFSYWMFNHFDKLHPDVGRAAARECLEVTKLGGMVTVGPIIGLTVSPRSLKVEVTKSTEPDYDHIAGQMIAATSLKAYVARGIQRATSLPAHPSVLAGFKAMSGRSR